MMFLCEFSEYGSTKGVSMKEYCQPENFEGKERIVSYLRNNGKACMVRAKLATDRFTGERINGVQSLTLCDDGRFEWYNDLAYHVEKYNLRLPKEFEDYVLSLK